jgi:hypothetical protein
MGSNNVSKQKHVVLLSIVSSNLNLKSFDLKHQIEKLTTHKSQRTTFPDQIEKLTTHKSQRTTLPHQIDKLTTHKSQFYDIKLTN